MEEGVFLASAVAEELEGFIEVRLHNDHYDEEKLAETQKIQQEMVQSIAAPVYAVVDPSTGKKLSEQHGPTTESGFLDFLRVGAE